MRDSCCGFERSSCPHAQIALNPQFCIAWVCWHRHIERRVQSGENCPPHISSSDEPFGCSLRANVYHGLLGAMILYIFLIRPYPAILIIDEEELNFQSSQFDMIVYMPAAYTVVIQAGRQFDVCWPHVFNFKRMMFLATQGTQNVFLQQENSSSSIEGLIWSVCCHSELLLPRNGISPREHLEEASRAEASHDAADDERKHVGHVRS